MTSQSDLDMLRMNLRVMRSRAGKVVQIMTPAVMVEVSKSDWLKMFPNADEIHVDGKVIRRGKKK